MMSLSHVWIAAGSHAIEAKLALGLVLLFEFRLNLFLRRLEEHPDAPPFGQFDLWYCKLPLSMKVAEEFTIEDDSLVDRCLAALAETEACLAASVEMVMNSPVSWLPHPLCGNPVYAICGARSVQNQFWTPLMASSRWSSFYDRRHDEHLWSYVETLTPILHRRKK